MLESATITVIDYIHADQKTMVIDYYLLKGYGGQLVCCDCHSPFVYKGYITQEDSITLTNNQKLHRWECEQCGDVHCEIEEV